MADNLVQVTLKHDSGLPEDVTVNTWSIFTATPKAAAEMTLAKTAIVNFYTAISGYLSSNLSGDATIKAYDRSDLAPRIPWFSETFTVVPGSAAALPQEVAFCLSFHAAGLSGAPAGRRRGRVYLGPLGGNTGGNGAAANKPVSTFMTAVRNAAAALLTASDSAPEWNWNVWSELDGLGRPVVGGHVDDAYDTQRRRGLAPSTRTTFGV